MSAQVIEPASDTPEYRYLLWRTVKRTAGQAPGALRSVEASQAEHQARREYALIAKALERPEAGRISVQEETVSEAVAAMAAEYSSEAAFEQELHEWGLDRQRLAQAVEAELRAGLLLDGIAAGPAISEQEVRTYYEENRERMVRPEIRGASHILITVNDEYPENRRDRAHARIRQLAETLEREPERFGDLALANSECPSAVERGRMGRARRGQLYPELEQALFELDEGAISGILESSLGFHIVRCDAIVPAGPIPFSEAAPRIRSLLEDRARKRRVKAWLEG